jgi:hypothetical protein
VQLLILKLDTARAGWATGDPNPKYRGTFRPHPYYVDTLPDTHEVNQAFFWFLDEGGELGTVRDVKRAQKLVDAYRQLDPPQEFEIVEAIKPNKSPHYGEEFLGIDLSCGLNNSLLWCGLRLVGKGFGTRKIHPRLQLIEEQFIPMLNDNGLFDDLEAASLCLSRMLDIQRLHPNLFESDERSDFETVALYRVPRDLAS